MTKKQEEVEADDIYFEKGGLIECAELCKTERTDCPCNDCKYWINYPKELNCALISCQLNGPMTLRDVGKRLGISHVAVQHIENKALLKTRRALAKGEMKEEIKGNAYLLEKNKRKISL